MTTGQELFQKDWTLKTEMDSAKAWDTRLRGAERKHGFDRGFHLLYSPWKTLATPKAIFLSLNPSEAPEGADIRKVSDERGNSYWVERRTTKSKITAQFLLMCDFLELSHEEVLAGTFSPFRSDRWKDLSLEQRKAGISIGEEFWGDVLANTTAQVLIACCPEAARFGAEVWQLEEKQKLPSGWGNYTIDRWEGSGRLVVRLPHLSTFQLFSRPQCFPCLEAAFEDHTD